MDQGALAILRAFREAGHQAYAVGGCVRDILMERKPHDWDIAVSAGPEDISRILQANGWKTVDVGGRQFGVIVAVRDGASYEVASFRKEVYGKDSHRPEEVSFTESLKADLSRRDFTVNAMALDERGVIYDYFGGQEDLERKVLRAVGDPARRFREDALRMFRLCRFAGQLDFRADSDTVDAMKAAFPRVNGISLDRVKNEVDRLLVTEHPGKGLDILVRSGLGACACLLREHGQDQAVEILPELTHLVDLPQMKAYHKYDAWYHTLAVVEAAPPELILRWAALLHDVGKGLPGVRVVSGARINDYNHDQEGAALADALLSRWRRTDAFRERVVWLVANHMKFHYYANYQDADVVRWVRRLAQSKTFSSQKDMIEAIRQLTALCEADVIGCGRPLTATEGHAAFGRCMADVASAMPVKAGELAYDDRVIRTLGSHVAEGMKSLLRRVQEGTLVNDAGVLYGAAVRFARRQGGGHEEK